MTSFSLGARESGDEIPTSFAEYINVISGRSLISGADWGRDRLEFGLSGDGMIRIFWTPSGIHANFISTTNVGEIPPLMIKLADEDKKLPARLLEARLHALRNLYAVVQLISTDRTLLLERALLSDRDIDFETLLSPDEYLYVECLAPGSWYITLWSKVRSSYRSILQTVALVYERGREAMLRKMEAEARLKELEVEAKEFELAARRIDYGLGLLGRLTSDPAKAALKERVERDVSAFLLDDRNSDRVQSATRRLLQPPLEGDS